MISTHPPELLNEQIRHNGRQAAEMEINLFLFLDVVCGVRAELLKYFAQHSCSLPQKQRRILGLKLGSLMANITPFQWHHILAILPEDERVRLAASMELVPLLLGQSLYAIVTECNEPQVLSQRRRGRGDSGQWQFPQSDAHINSFLVHIGRR
jgi:hypothetical protein